MENGGASGLRQGRVKRTAPLTTTILTLPTISISKMLSTTLTMPAMDPILLMIPMLWILYVNNDDDDGHDS
jgi:hypothetical protein